MAGRLMTVMDLGDESLVAASVRISSDGLAVHRSVVARRPEDIDVRDAEAVGAWVGERLREAGIPRGRAVVSLSRSEVVLKRLQVPDNVDASELGDVVRLQMMRQLTMPMEGTAVDYMPIESAEEGSFLIAGAAPGDRISWVRRVAKAAGMRVDRVHLRASGVAALIRELSEIRSGPVLGVALGGRAIEFVVVESGQMVFTRAADADPTMPPARYAHRVAVEAKRTWMSYRVGQGAVEIEAIGVIGEGDLVREVGEACASEMELPWVAVEPPTAVTLPDDVEASVRQQLMPLVGLLVREHLGMPTLDFANPRKGPDRFAKVRQLALGVAALLIISCSFGAYFAHQDLESLRGREAEVRSERGKLVEQYKSHLQVHARAAHIDAWLDTGVDWLSHVRQINTQMPSPEVAIIDTLRGDVRQGVQFVTTNRRYEGGEFQGARRVELHFEGRTGDRDVATDLRERFVEGDLYVVQPTGPDVPGRFQLNLTTGEGDAP
ncbi:MAG: pilus assembly protein PilM [Phycisphaerales bacterium]|nr:pilus assembly protein PilM [Phycisphaerales bacterium]